MLMSRRGGLRCASLGISVVLASAFVGCGGGDDNAKSLSATAAADPAKYAAAQAEAKQAADRAQAAEARKLKGKSIEIEANP